MADKIGMMNNAYFVSRKEVLNWINSTLQLNLKKIEELGSGAVYCQLFDSIYPKKIRLNKVKWRAKLPYEYVHNYKLLQKAFDATGHKKHIEVQKLIKAKYQDNLEFAQWFKAFYDMHSGQGSNYDPIVRRGNADLGGFFGVPKGKKSVKPVFQNHKAPVRNRAPATNPRRGKAPRDRVARRNSGEQDNSMMVKKLTSQLNKVKTLLQLDQNPALTVRDLRELFGMEIVESKPLMMPNHMVSGAMNEEGEREFIGNLPGPGVMEEEGLVDEYDDDEVPDFLDEDEDEFDPNEM